METQILIESDLETALVKAGAKYFGANNVLAMGGGLIKFTNKDEKTFVLDIITIPPSERRKGYGTQIMNWLIELADETGTTIELTIADIKRCGGFINQHNDIIGMNAIIKTNKIPVNKLKGWYSKFGFVPNGKEGRHQKIIRTPKTL